jgi:hypothetical protein
LKHVRIRTVNPHALGLVAYHRRSKKYVNDVLIRANERTLTTRKRTYPVLPLTVLRRLDCVLADTRQKVLEAHAKHKGKSPEVLEKLLNRAAGQQFHNTSSSISPRLPPMPTMSLGT